MPGEPDKHWGTHAPRSTDEIDAPASATIWICCLEPMGDFGTTLHYHLVDGKRFLRKLWSSRMGESQPTPSFTGLIVHRDPGVGYSLLLPDGWQRTDLPDNGGTLYRPDPDDPTTGLEASGQHLGTDVTASDLPTIRRGFLAGLRQLQECKIEHQEDAAIGALLTLEARLTYQQDETVRKRWVRLLYQGQTQIRLVAEGSTVERFGYWEPMFVTAIRSVRFGDWWAEAIGVQWMDSPFADGNEEPPTD